MKKIIDRMNAYIRASYPLIYIVSYEEQRVEEALGKVVEKLERSLLIWTSTQGFVDADSKRTQEGTEDPILALDFVLNNCDKRPYLFLMKDLHFVLSNPMVVRKLRDCCVRLTKTYSSMLILSPLLKLPTELEKDVTVVDYPLPDRNDFIRLLNEMAEFYKDRAIIDPDPMFREQIADALLGMTLTEAENMLACAVVEDARLDERDIPSIIEGKRQVIRKSGMLEFYPLDEKLDAVGGLSTLKKWLQRKRVCFHSRAREYGLEVPRGVLLIGVPGCGKSLTAKAVASEWKMPLLRFDIGKVFGMYVGQSEENIRRAIHTAESIAPSVLWIDELEKGFSGVGASDADSGVGARVFGTFITWLQEKKAPVFVVATANDVSRLPAELLRKGRFDEMFFIDLPNMADREEIFKIHLKRSKRDPEKYDTARLAKNTEGFTGSDVEGVVKAALEEAFLDDERELTTEDIMVQIAQTLPLSATMKERIDALRNWANTRARHASDHGEEVPVYSVESFARHRTLDF